MIMTSTLLSPEDVSYVVVEIGESTQIVKRIYGPYKSRKKADKASRKLHYGSFNTIEIWPISKI